MTSNIRGVVVGLAFISGCAADSGRDVLAAPASSELTQAGSREQESKPDADDPPPGTTVLRGQEAFEQTVGVVAKQHGLTFDEAHAAMSFQRDFASYAEDLLSRYPNELGAIWVDPIPAKRGHIVWVGSVPKEEMAAPSGVELKGGATIPMDDQYIRVQALSETMVELGHTVHSISYEQQSQRIILQAQPDTAGKMVDLDALTTQAAARLKAIPGLGEKSAVLSPRDIDLSEGAEAMEPNSARAAIGWTSAPPTSARVDFRSETNQAPPMVSLRRGIAAAT